MKKKGFTLIELLVVIAIIALLASILFPVFAKARDKARTATCASNLKQIGSAIFMYVQDWDECFPVDPRPRVYGYTWANTLKPYLGDKSTGNVFGKTGVMFCPSDTKKLPDNTQFRSSYGLSIAFSGDNAPRPPWYCPVPLPQVKHLSEQLLVTESNLNTGYYCQVNRGSVANWHNGRANVLFCDGHVKSEDATRLNTQAYTDEQYYAPPWNYYLR